MTPVAKPRSRKQSNADKLNRGVYQRLALVYDLMSSDEHSLRMVPYTERIFRRFHHRAYQGLDLCCGTGSAALALAEAGYRMYGIDGSSEMLKRAKAKLRLVSRGIYKPVTFSLGALPDFRSESVLAAERFDQTLDFVTSFYDSLNYLLTERELVRAFRTVSSLLKQGGLFVFDLNSASAYQDKWGGRTYAGARDDFAWIWTNEPDIKRKRLEIETTFFLRKGRSANWVCHSETHTQQAYSIGQVRKALTKSGFNTLGVYRCYTFVKATKKDFRHCFVACKK